MNRILKLKNNLLTLALNPSEVPINRLLHDTKFLFYCFRHYKYVDNNFNLKISSLLLNNLHKYQKPAEKSRAISLIVQIHLINNLKISPAHSQVLLENLQASDEVPNLRWLVNTAVIFLNSGINSATLWKVIQKHYLNNDFSGTNQVQAEDLLKLAFIMSSSKTQNAEIWQRLIRDLINQKESLNSSQKVMLAKSLCKIDAEGLFTGRFVEEEFKPYLYDLIQSAAKDKELLTLREITGLILAAEEAQLLNENIIQKVEGKLFEKSNLLSKRNIYDLMKTYNKLPLNKDRKQFIKGLKKVLLSKFDKKIGYRDALNFNVINNYLYKNGIISLQEFNDPYFQFILDDKFEVFEHLYVARMKTSSIVDVMNFSLLVQGQLSKHMLQLNPETLVKVLGFLELRGEISDTFLQMALEGCRKYTQPVHEKHVKQQLYAYLLFGKYDASVNGSKLTRLAEQMVEKLEQLGDMEVKEEVFKYIAYHQSELAQEFTQKVKEFYQEKFGKLSEHAIYNLLSMVNEKDFENNAAFKEIVEDYILQDFKYMKTSALCRSFHIIKAILPKEYGNLAAEHFMKNRLNLEELEILTRRISSLPAEVKQDIQESFRVNKEYINWKNVGLAGRIMQRVFDNAQFFDKSFIKECLEVVSAYQSFFNQGTLDKLIDGYSKATSSSK